MKLKALMETLQYWVDQGCEDFDVVVPRRGTGHLQVRDLGVGVAQPEEKLLALGCDGFVLRTDLYEPPKPQDHCGHDWYLFGSMDRGLPPSGQRCKKCNAQEWFR